MPRILLPGEKGSLLNTAEGEANYALFRASQSVTIAASGVLTVEGTGRYKVLPNTGTTDDITGIVVSAENLEGCLIQLRPETNGHILTLVHGTNLKLLNTQNQVLSTIYTTIWVRYYGASVWVQEHPVLYTA